MKDLLGMFGCFRKEDVAVMKNIKSMLHQFVVAEEHRDLLRFLWQFDGHPSKEVIDYRMKVHLFGVSSFPRWANFGLRWAVDDGEEDFGTDAVPEFYVADGLNSVSTVPESIQLIKASQAIYSKVVSDCIK